MVYSGKDGPKLFESPNVRRSPVRARPGPIFSVSGSSSERASDGLRADVGLASGPGSRCYLWYTLHGYVSNDRILNAKLWSFSFYDMTQMDFFLIIDQMHERWMHDLVKCHQNCDMVYLKNSILFSNSFNRFLEKKKSEKRCFSMKSHYS